MKAFLLHPDRDFELKGEPPALWPILRRDLQLDVLIEAMAHGDARVREVAERAMMLSPANDAPTVAHRQAALKDSLRNPDAVRNLYDLAQEAFARQHRVWGHFRDYPSGRLDYAVSQMDIFIDVLHRIRRLADINAETFDSKAFRRLFATLADQLSDDYFELVEDHLRRLKFRRGVLVSARLGKSLKGIDYVLRRPAPGAESWLNRLLPGHTPHYTIYLAPRDEAGANAMSELRDRGLGLAADALARSAQHILNFFEMFLVELAFYVGCLNLHERLRDLGAPFAFPTVEPGERVVLEFEGLYDVNLALSAGRRLVGNDLNADGKPLIVVTGANQGGKTTFLRGLGAAQLMAQSGMFAPAERLRVGLVGGLYTHFKREEDASMKSGKFDEELGRMCDIVDHLAPRSLILFNESFSATNEREGAEIARQVVAALLERGHRIAFVSHQFAFSHAMYERDRETAAFLRADRQNDGSRSFKLVEGEPLGASFGDDVYRELFESRADARQSQYLGSTSPMEAST